jgi:hypothetical protein
MCYNTGMKYVPKPYTLLSVDEHGNEIRQYEDGTLRNQKGHALTKIPNDGHEITHENARDYHRMRKEKIIRAIEERLQDVTKTNAPAYAIAAIVEKRARIAMTDETRTGNEAARIVLSAVDAYQDKRDAEKTTVQRHEYSMDNETRALLEAVLAERRTNVRENGDTEEIEKE